MEQILVPEVQICRGEGGGGGRRGGHSRISLHIAGKRGSGLEAQERSRGLHKHVLARNVAIQGPDSRADSVEGLSCINTVHNALRWVSQGEPERPNLRIRISVRIGVAIDNTRPHRVQTGQFMLESQLAIHGVDGVTLSRCHEGGGVPSVPHSKPLLSQQWWLG
jgi:hypothetical protein